MDGVHNPHDDGSSYGMHSQWVDLGNLHHPLSPHDQQFAAGGPHYGYVESPGFAPPDSPFRLQPAPISPGYIGMPQWNHQAMQQQVSSYPPAPQAIAPAPHHHPQPLAPAPMLSAPPIRETTHSTSSPRRTLTDQDRKMMCQFHEKNPTVKQTEIGAMFGVERSTVSKVLRQKEKYLYPEDGSRSPIKRSSKGKFPDIERALSVWAKNSRQKGIPLTDVSIREKARHFALSVGISESQFKANSAGWLEKFKQKNNLHVNGRGRSESDVTGLTRPTRAGHARRESTPNVAAVIAAAEGEMMQHSKSQDSQNTSTDSSDSFMDINTALKGFHDSSGTSSTFTSSGALGPASPASPFFSPESRLSSAQPSPGFPSQQARLPPGVQNQQRPRSQTFPILPLDPSYISPPPSSEPLTPKIAHQTAGPPLASPATDPPNPLDTPSSIPPGPQPTRDEARKAMEVVMNFLRQQPEGFVEQEEYAAVGKLLGKFDIDDEARDADGEMEFSVDDQIS